MGFRITIGLLLVALSSPAAWAIARPPGQPETGPGGGQYRHAGVTQTRIGEGDSQYWIYEPSDPTPPAAPVIVFLHGWSATNPMVYGGWLRHLVRRGNIVIYPRYQASLLTPSSRFASNAIEAIDDALEYLKSGKHVRPDYARVAFVGHSVGGTLAANLAAQAGLYELPIPKVLMCIEPAWQLKVTERGSAFDDLGRIPASTLLLAVAGDSDELVGQRGARQIFGRASRVLPRNKNLIIVRSDYHGFGPLLANHFAPLSFDKDFDSREPLDPVHFTVGLLAKQTTNALDYYGFWKLLDGLTDAAFYGKNRACALGDTPQQRFMGVWSDGTPVKELIVTQEEDSD